MVNEGVGVARNGNTSDNLLKVIVVCGIERIFIKSNVIAETCESTIGLICAKGSEVGHICTADR